MSRWAGVLCLALLLPACGVDPSLSPLPPGARILAFGDSLTHGTGAGNGDSYPQVLAALSGREVIAAGVPGELSAQGLARLPEVLAETRPALVLLCHGGNDMLRRRPQARAAENISAMIALIRASGAEVVLIGVPQPSLLLSAADFYTGIAEREAVVFEADALADILGDAGLKADPVHPNAEGYRELATRLHHLLHKAGAL